MIHDPIPHIIRFNRRVTSKVNSPSLKKPIRSIQIHQILLHIVHFHFYLVLVLELSFVLFLLDAVDVVTGVRAEVVRSGSAAGEGVHAGVGRLVGLVLLLRWWNV